MKTRSGHPALLRDIVTAEIGRAGGNGWSIGRNGFWSTVLPAGRPVPAQGWKLHLSATMLSAPVVLSCAARVLVEAECAFKFPIQLSEYWKLLEPHCARAQAGKFVTVYPRDDAESVRLAALLDEATRGLPGPVILSDRPYREGGIVYYRYGAFTGHRVLGDDGFYEVRLRTPDGGLLLDERRATFSPPPFATCPFEAPPPRRSAGSVLLNDRFLVRTAVRHANRGGVYYAEDTKTGREVVIKEGRPHACADLRGVDAAGRITAEHLRLRELAPSGVVPDVVDFFEQAGHAFLVEERFPGLTLQRWVDRHTGPLGESGFGLDAARVLPLVTRLLDLVRAVHARDRRIGDLSPNNVMVLPDGELRLIDLEHAAVPGDVVLVGGTAGYLAPERADQAGRLAPAPEESADRYSLGALVYLLAVGAHLDPPVLARVAATAADHPTLALLRPLVEGLVAAEPERRWSLDACERFLAGLRPGAAASGGTSPAPRLLDRLVDDGIAYLVETMDASESSPSPWPNVTDDIEADPCAISGGAPGILGVLTLALPSAPEDDAVEDAVAAACRWLRRRLEDEDVWRPGLYFGRSGALWALHDAASAIGDTETAEFAARAALRLPADGPSPDVTHGLAGCGLAVLHLASRTGDPGLREHAVRIFDRLLGRRSYLDGHPQWPTPESHDSGLAGTNHFGFAHGIAGIGAALLYASQALDRPDWMAAVDEIARTFAAYAEVDGDTAWWPTVRDDPETARPRRPHWCSGSSGIGTFLVRHWMTTGDAASLDLARKAAVAVHRTRRQSGPAACHGLPGDGEFLLDMAQLTGEERYRRWALDLAGCLELTAVERTGRLLVPDNHGDVVPTYLGGTAGTLAFLLRLRHRHQRMWLPDPLRLAAPDRGRR
ncbi:class IV lanthionine synthetase LanL [Microtetraspora malaysiensis]|uniref:class IV lanthionine synthetase LanL n=1 Tax=Microtetraspora malaysiensis TaxID=161358 RepID=UPI003D8DF9F3